MERERWPLVEELYHAALEHGSEEREAFLKEASPDEDVRREVESLLRFDASPVSMLDQPAWERKLRRGDRLGPYEILERIGRGGMGEVWKARDGRLARIVAIKSPASRFSERIEREARAIAALNHPHICAIYDVGPDYLVMEYVEGSPLRVPFPLQKAIEYALQILDALDAAHSHGIVHRDLKPANILVTKAGVKLVDFGLAKSERAQAAAADMNGVSREGMVAGTPEYMAPEQAAGGTVDSRADIYAFGCVFFEMLTGKRVSGASRVDTIGSLGDGFLDGFVQRCLHTNPEQRWQSAKDVRAALILRPDAQPGPKMNRRGWIATTTAGVAVAGALAGGGAMAWLYRTTPIRAKPLRVDISPPEGGQFPAVGIRTSFALSPDGRAAVCVVTLRGKTSLWLRPLDGAPPRILCETGNNPSPFWSPDGQFVAFENRRGGLERLDIRLGTQWNICDLPGGFAGGSWNSDGDILLGGRGVLRVPASGGTLQQITNPDPSLKESGHLWPQALPNNRFLYFAKNESPGKSGIYAGWLSRPADRVHLLTTEANALFAPGGDGIDYLIWYRDGILFAREFDTAALSLRGEPHEVANLARVTVDSAMIASASANGSLLFSTAAANPSSLGWFGREGKLLRTIGEPAEYMTCRLSPDGRRIAASRSKPDGPHEIWILDANRETSDRFALCDFGGLSAWSVDGQALAYSLPGFHLVRQRLVGGEKPTRVTNSQNPQLVNDWSLDGRFILYQEMEADRGFDVMVAEIEPDGSVFSNRPWLSTPYYESDARFAPTPNPRWVSYMSDETGRYEIYIDSFPKPGRKTRVSINGGRFAQWRGDGRELFFLSADYKLMAANVNVKPHSVETSAPRELFQILVSENLTSPYEAARDGQRFLVRTAAAQSEPLTLILNWPSLMKEKAPR